MMVAIEVEWILGTIRAGSSEDLAASGSFDPGEWPPSPARLFSALVAADGTQGRARVSGVEVLDRLEQARPPRITADSRRFVCPTALLPRYVVRDESAKGSEVQNYPARRAEEVRPGTRLSPRRPVVWYLWGDLELSGPELEDLRRRAARIGYVGCADSPARVRVFDHAPSDVLVAPSWEPLASGGDPAVDVALPVPYPGFLSVLDEAFVRFSSGQATRRSWLRTEHRWYRPPEVDIGDGLRPCVFWLRLPRAVPGRLALAVTATFKKAVLDHYGRLFGDDPDHQSAPPVLTGHGFTRPGYHQAYWLALPDVGQPHADGRLHGLAICLPAGSDALLLEPLRTALAGLRELVLPGGRRIDVRSFAGERRPLAANPARWLGPSRRWVSALPVVHERRRRHGPTLSDAVEWCRHAGFPDPVGFRTSPVPLIPGAVVLAPAETRRAGHEGRPFSHIELEFSLEVTGPVVLGRGRQFGLGLCAPVPESGSHGKPMPGADVTGD